MNALQQWGVLPQFGVLTQLGEPIQPDQELLDRFAGDPAMRRMIAAELLARAQADRKLGVPAPGEVGSRLAGAR